MSSLSISCQRPLTQERSLQIIIKSSTQFSIILILSLKIAVRLESPDPNSQLPCQSESHVTTSLSWNKAPIWGLRPDLYYCQTVAGLLMWGTLSDERMGLSFIIAAGRFSPAQSFSGPSPVGLATIFYCLRFETSLYVASYDSQGCDGGIRPRLHTELPCQFFWNLVI
jgi:hypothetical protein